ncbi:mechanosensitive ion channel family protein [bacterium]|nr:mechanosensitive ion channel family protein [bacterium]
MNPKVPVLIQSISDALTDFASAKTVTTAVSVALILVVGLAVLRVLLNAIKRFSRKGLPARSATILVNLIKYGGYTLVFLTASKRAGLDISALMGAAGIAGIALGFAAQTSVANVISGLFLFSEKVFQIGDTLQIDALTGVVEAVDFMCIRIRTFDNRLVRVPNETLIKANIVNVTYFPQRRLDLWLSVAADCDFALLFDTARATIAASPLALKDPAPVLIVDSMTQDGANVLIAPWARKDDLIALKNGLIPALLSALAEKGIRPQARRVEVGVGAAETLAAGAGAAAARGDRD